MEFLLSREALVKLKAKALRRGIWYKAMTRMERAFLDLTINSVKKFELTALGIGNKN